MSDIVECATLEDIAVYLQREEGIDAQLARVQAKQVIDGFVDMRAKGLIKGWYFDEQNHLELLPSDAAMKIIANQK
ncbi:MULTISPECIES: hypothetical protein [unclassified Photobacterium]|uniref:hypothetical protein n=1 Tax=unclassified Photobacterium TaxID=2628852 RepID=UPI001B8C32FC|nr:MULTISPECIES: hypothetical protein [unclassified Photobacterium]MDO6705808.1 hypothetical protein [Photobacterium sp. 1_MG-2023]QUJ68308.1 hypothetical protein KDD30_04005 [Photobacterium sp. GJ3]